MSGAAPTLVVSGYASVDYALRLAPFQGFDATTTVRGRADEWPRHGGIAHVVRAARRASPDLRVAALSWVADDAEGRAWSRAVASCGADTAGIAVSGRRSPSAHLLYPEGQGTICLFDPGDCRVDALTPPQQRLLAEADLAVVAVGPASATRELLDAIPAGCRVLWILKQDPASLPAALADELSARADVITLSEGESGYLAGIAQHARPGAFVVVTRGTRGAELLRVTEHGELADCGSVPTTPIDGVDTTGAGDTFSGALAALISVDPDPRPDAMLAAVARASETTARTLAERGHRTDHTPNHEENER